MTTVATFGATPVPSEAVAIPPKRHRNFRIEDEEWLTFARISELLNKRTSDRIRDMVRSDNARHRKLVADDPVLAQRLEDLRVQREQRAAESPATAAEQQERTQ